MFLVATVSVYEQYLIVIDNTAASSLPFAI